MFEVLFTLAGLGMPAWLLLLFLPGWRVTRWLAETRLFPLYLSAIYSAGAIALLIRFGPGVVSRFGSQEGVRWLLAEPDVALVAWIHLLAFDQLVGLLIYRENMEHRYVSLPVQSLILVLTLAFGPLGFLTYFLARLWGAPAGLARRLPGPLAEEPALTWTGLAGLALAGLCAAAIAVRGVRVPPEGDLTKALTFDLAVGIYLLTLAPMLPLAGFSPRARRWWRLLSVVLTVYSYGVETVQSFRGLDPRFSRAGGPLDQLASGLFGLVSLAIIALFVLLTWQLFRSRRAGERPLLLLGIRYGSGAAILAFAAGLWMIALQGRYTGGGGNLIWLHALGFHGLQAVPLVAWLLERAAVPPERARRTTHVAGLAWLGACLLVGWQTALGLPVTRATPIAAGYLGALLVWAAALALAAAWRRGHAARVVG